MRSFADLFCEQYHVAPDRFARAMFWRCLHRRALLFAPVILLLKPVYFATDFELILNVGQLTEARHLTEAVDDFQLHPWNHGFLRRRLKIRVSGARLGHVVHQVLQRATAA